MRQMAPNVASVTGLAGKTFHPFVCPLHDACRDHIIRIPLFTGAISQQHSQTGCGSLSFDGVVSGELVSG